MKKISVIGPESTGKTTLCKQLASHYQSIWLPEYARTYVENLNRKYTYEDVLHIAKKQIEQEKNYTKIKEKFLFLDTDLIITKIWFKYVYDKIPDWIDDEIIKNKADFYLLCYYDLPWIQDDVRENSGETRKILYEMYKMELKLKHFPFKTVKGKEKARFINAINNINFFFDFKIQ